MGAATASERAPHPAHRPARRYRSRILRIPLAAAPATTSHLFRSNADAAALEVRRITDVRGRGGLMEVSQPTTLPKFTE